MKRNKKMVFKSFPGAKKNRQRFPKLSGARRNKPIIPILFRTKVEQIIPIQSFKNLVEQTKVVQKGLKWNRRTLHKLDPNGFPDLDCDRQNDLHPGSVHRHGVLSS